MYGGRKHIFYGYDGVPDTYNIENAKVAINVNPTNSVNNDTPDSDLIVGKAITILTSSDLSITSCDAKNEGAIKYLTGTPGHFYGCAKITNSTYEWKQLNN